MTDTRAKRAEDILTRPAGITVLPDELGRSQFALGQGATGSLGEHPLPAFKTFHSVINVPTGEEQVSLGADENPFAGMRPDFRPIPRQMNVPHGNEQVTVGR